MPYKSNILQTVFFFLLLLICNLFFGTINHSLYNYNGRFSDGIERIPSLVFCSGLFFLGTIVFKKEFLRICFLPILRILFWTLIVLDGFFSHSRLNAEDFLYANNEMFFWWTTIKIMIDKLDLNNEFFNLFIIDIFSIAVGELLLILASRRLQKAIQKLLSKPKHI